MRKSRIGFAGLCGLIVVLLAGFASAVGAQVGELTYLHCYTNFPTGCGDSNRHNLPGLADANDVTVSPDGTSVYATAPASQAVVVFSRDASGSLIHRECFSSLNGVCGPSNDNRVGLSGARGVAVSPDGKSVYVASSGSHLTRFDRNSATGLLTYQGCVSSIGAVCSDPVARAGLGGALEVAVSPDGEDVYVVGGSDNAIVRLDRNTTTGAVTYAGCLTFQSTATVACGAGNDNKSGMNAPEGVAVSPEGRNVYVVSAGSASLVRFDRSASGALTHVGCLTHFDPGLCGLGNGNKIGLAGATGVAVSFDGKSVYTAAVGSSALTRFDRDLSTGSVSYVGCYTSGSGCPGGSPFNAIPGLSGAWGVTVSPDGRSVYVGAESDHAVSRFDRDPVVGAVTYRGCIQSAPAGCGPGNVSKPGLDAVRSVAVSPDGRSLYGAAYVSDAVVRFDRVPDEPPACSPPVAIATPINTPISVLLGCSDPNGDPFAVTFPTSPSKAAISLTADGGGVVYTPTGGSTGADAFSVRGQNPWGVAGPVANVAVTITSPAPPPASPTPPPVKRLAATSVFRLIVQGNTFRVLTLRVARAAKGARVSIRCTKACAVRRTIALRKTSGSFQALFRGKILRPGAVIEVRVTKAGFIGRLFRYRLLRGNFEKIECNILRNGKLASCRKA